MTWQFAVNRIGRSLMLIAGTWFVCGVLAITVATVSR